MLEKTICKRSEKKKLTNIRILVFLNKCDLNFFFCSGASATLFGIAGALAFLFVSDWKVTNRYIPYYGSSKRFDEPKE